MRGSFYNTKPHTGFGIQSFKLERKKKNIVFWEKSFQNFSLGILHRKYYAHFLAILHLESCKRFHLTGNSIFFYATPTMSYRPSGTFFKHRHLLLRIFFQIVAHNIRIPLVYLLIKIFSIIYRLGLVPLLI